VIRDIHVTGVQTCALPISRFAKSFARGKHKIKYWGKKRIEQELKYRYISAYKIKNALKEIVEDYINTFLKIAENKWLSINEDNLEKKKKKWVDYLYRKGFETSLIFETLQDFLNRPLSKL